MIRIFIHKYQGKPNIKDNYLKFLSLPRVSTHSLIYAVFVTPGVQWSAEIKMSLNHREHSH